MVVVLNADSGRENTESSPNADGTTRDGVDRNDEAGENASVRSLERKRTRRDTDKLSLISTATIDEMRFECSDD
jgi:hypothetical protein